ncbi:MAG: serine protease [Acidimicrobiia bacterium]
MAGADRDGRSGFAARWAVPGVRREGRSRIRRIGASSLTAVFAALTAVSVVACTPDTQVSDTQVSDTQVSDDRVGELREERDALEQEVALLEELLALERQLEVEAPPGGEAASDAETPPGGEFVDIDALRHELYRLKTEVGLAQIDEHPPGASVTSSGFPVDRLDEARQVADRLRPAVLLFEAEFGQGIGGQATAFLIEPDLAVTNHHNVVQAHGRATNIVLQSIDGERFGATVIGENQALDAAVLRLERPADLPTIPWGDPRDLASGDPVMSIGHPGRMGSWVVAVGTFQRFDQINGIEVRLLGQTGSSGSPVVDLDGRLVGLYFGAQSEVSSREPAPLDIHSVVSQTAAETGLATASHKVRQLVEELTAEE